MSDGMAKNWEVCKAEWEDYRVQVAVVLERAVLRPLSGQPAVSVMMATIGMASIIHGGVEAVWGGDTYSPPTLLPRTPIKMGDIPNGAYQDAVKAMKEKEAQKQKP